LEPEERLSFEVFLRFVFFFLLFFFYFIIFLFVSIVFCLFCLRIFVFFFFLFQSSFFMSLFFYVYTPPLNPPQKITGDFSRPTKAIQAVRR